MARCKSCGERIEWVKTPRGRPMPINPEPDPDHGNLRVVDGHMIRSFWYEEAATLRRAGDELYLSHFATCSHADEHRKVER